MSAMIGRLVILGPGLLGASLALAAKARGAAREVTVWARRVEACDEALKRGIADAASLHVPDAVQDADLVVLATPMPAFSALVRQAMPVLPAGALITDVGSVKNGVLHDLLPELGARADCYVGAHPMAGSEYAGMEHARADLFDNAACAVAPGPQARPDAVERVMAFWGAIGCRVVRMAPEEHDRAVALVSHLVHLTAASLVNTATAEGGSNALDLAGPGFRDATRVALGPPELWTDILAANRAEIVRALRDLGGVLGGVADTLARGGDVTEFLARARETRRLCQLPNV
jgi:prephenate dehydrogenase